MKKEKNNVKENIYRTAIVLFARFGYENVTVESITKCAGISKGAFYSHFACKQDILVAFFSHIDNHYVESWSLVKKENTTQEKLLKFVTIMMTYIRDSVGIDFMKIIYSNQLSSDITETFIIDKNRILYRCFEEIVKYGKKSNELKTDISDENMVEQLVFWCRGLIYDWCIYDNSYDLIERSLEYFKFVFPLIGTEFMPTNN